MIVISHRGYWLAPAEKNTQTAFERSFGLHFGTETDVRDCSGHLVISHDMPQGGEMLLDTFMELLAGQGLMLAMNIKADGLAEGVRNAMARHPRDQWFVFDMSVPDMRAHLIAGNPVFARMSEVEHDPAWFERVDGIWLDSFEGEWFDAGLIRRLLSQDKRVCVVSPELHGRDPLGVWTALLPLAGEAGLILCSDFPERARAFFAGNTQ